MRSNIITANIGAILLLLLLIMGWSEIKEGLQLMKKEAQKLFSSTTKDEPSGLLECKDKTV